MNHRDSFGGKQRPAGLSRRSTRLITIGLAAALVTTPALIILPGAQADEVSPSTTQTASAPVTSTQATDDAPAAQTPEPTSPDDDSTSVPVQPAAAPSSAPASPAPQTTPSPDASDSSAPAPNTDLSTRGTSEPSETQAVAVVAAALEVATPAEGSVSNEFLNLPRFTGSGEPGSTVTITYPNGSGGISTAGSGEVDSSGNFSILTNFGELAGGQAQVTATLTQTDGQGAPVGSPSQVTRSFTFANAPVAAAPFTVGSPANGSSVDSVSPTFTGTGIPGDTVTIVYSGQGPQTYTAGTATIDGDGNWSTATDFSKLAPGATDVRTSSTEYTPGGTEEYNASFFTNITFPSAPVVASPFTLTSPTEGETRNDFLNLVRFEGAGQAGNTVTISYFGKNGLAEAGTGLVDADGTFSILTNFGQLPPGQTFAQTFSTQTRPDGSAAANEIARSFNFATAPVAQYPFTITYPGTGETVDSVTPTFTGTATPGDTIRISYSGVGLQNYSAGEAPVDAAGNFSVPTSFPSLMPGETETRVAVLLLDADGNEVDRAYKLFDFPTAPVPVALATPVVNQPVVDGSRVTFSGTGVAGATVDVSLTNAALASLRALVVTPPATVSATVQQDGTWSTTTDVANGSYSATATQSTGNGADRSAPSDAVTFTVDAEATGTTPTGPGSGSGTPVVQVGGASSSGTPTSGRSASGLADTGSDLSGSLSIAALLLALGAGVAVAGRRVRGAFTKRS